MSNAIMVFYSVNADGASQVTIAGTDGDPKCTMSFPTPTSQTRFSVQEEPEKWITSARFVARAMAALVRQEAKGKLPGVAAEAETLSDEGAAPEAEPAAEASVVEAAIELTPAPEAAAEEQEVLVA